MRKKRQKYPVAQLPLILRYHRLMDAFIKSNDERDFYLDKIEGFMLYVDLEKDEEELSALEKELKENQERYCLIPKMSFFEIKKIMEGFVYEKVYDIDTKEKLLDIIGSRDARENFIEFIYDQLTELEKWQLYYQEKFRIKIIEWLRELQIRFVFEEDLDLNRNIIEKLKRTLFDTTVPKDVSQARSIICKKADVYYSSEALNPRPKRGRPPKQIAKIETEPQFTVDIYTTIPKSARPFLYLPEITSASSITFSSKFETEEQLLASLRGTTRIKIDEKLEALSRRLESLQDLSYRLGATMEPLYKEKVPVGIPKPKLKATKAAIEEEGKVKEAVYEVLPRKRGRPKKEKVKRKRFAIKKVTPIKFKRKKK